MKTLSLLLIAICLFAAPPVSAPAEDKIIIGLIPEMNVFKQKQRFVPLADYLSREIGVNVELTMLSRYGNIIQNFKDAKMDGAFLGSFTGALAVHQLNVEPLARPINLDGTSTYKGYIFVRQDSGIKNAADMKGKVMALVERATTAGYVFPLAWCKRQGINNMKEYFKETLFTGSHDAAIEAVLSRQADVGAAKNTIYDKLKASNPEIQANLIVLAASPDVPSNGLCVRPDLSPTIKAKLKEALLNLDNHPEDARVLNELEALRFIETSKADYQPVIDLANEAGLNLSDYQYFNQ
jgi:phosphonate transport system substrate-binding protein